MHPVTQHDDERDDEEKEIRCFVKMQEKQRFYGIVREKKSKPSLRPEEICEGAGGWCAKKRPSPQRKFSTLPQTGDCSRTEEERASLQALLLPGCQD